MVCLSLVQGGLYIFDLVDYFGGGFIVYSKTLKTIINQGVVMFHFIVMSPNSYGDIRSGCRLLDLWYVGHIFSR